MDYSIKNTVYIATNKLNNKSYIGCTTQKLSDRMRQHKNDSNNRPDKSLFCMALNEYGWSNFDWKVLHIVDVNGKDREEIIKELKEFEVRFVNKFDTFNSGYNSNIGGDGCNGLKGNKSHMYGKKHTKETRDKMKENHADFTGENNPFYGKKFTDEAKKKLSESRKGQRNYSKLTESDVKEILDLLKHKVFTQTKIAEIYNVNKMTVSDIKLVKTWRGVPR